MTSPKKDGGPAFPTLSPTFVVPKDIPEEWRNKCAVIASQVSGLSVRQAYKLAALQGILACGTGTNSNFPSDRELAEDAAWYADAMLAEDEEWEKKQNGM